MFEKFEKVKDHHILVIGDIILDKYIHGNTTRISPEAPVPIVLSEQESNVLGGAANVAANLTSLGAKVHLIGCVGYDADGDEAIRLAQEKLEDMSGILRSGKITTVKTRIVSKGQQMLRIDQEDAANISKDEENSILGFISQALIEKRITGIIMQDYNKGIFTPSLISKIISLSKESEIPFFVDPKHKNFWKFKGAALFKPNLSEILQANNSHEYTSLEDVLLTSADRLQCELLMCTLADEGIAFVQNEKVIMSPTQKIDVVDVSGAGDTSLSIMVLAYLLGYDAESIARLANLCGKVVCMKAGVSTMTIDELRHAFFGSNK